MTVGEKPDAALKQLTKCGLGKEKFYRREIVMRQLTEVLHQNESAVRRRVLILDEAEEGSLKSEALVYLLREFPPQTEMFHLIYETLSRRILRMLYKYRRKVGDFDEFLQSVNVALLEKILDFETNQGDYAQVSFGQFVLGLAQNELRKFGARERKDAVTDSTDDAAQDESKTEISDDEITVEKKLLLREAVNQLPENIKEACVLHFLKGWKIKSNDETEPTLVKHFRKSDRQIRNWLADAKRILADWQGVLR